MHLDCNNSNLEGAKLCQFTLRRHFTIVKWLILHTANIFLPFAGVYLKRVLKVKYSL